MNTTEEKMEDVAKAFQFGLALGFGKRPDEMDKVIDEIKKVITPQEFSEWLEDIAEKYKLDKDDVQTLIKQFLMS